MNDARILHNSKDISTLDFFSVRCTPIFRIPVTNSTHQYFRQQKIYPNLKYIYGFLAIGKMNTFFPSIIILRPLV